MRYKMLKNLIKIVAAGRICVENSWFCCRVESSRTVESHIFVLTIAAVSN